MWYEILPTFAIIVAALAAHPYVMMPIQWLLLGNCYHRSLDTVEDRMAYIRGRRLSGNPYQLVFCLPGGESEESDECRDYEEKHGNAAAGAEQSEESEGTDGSREE